MRIRVPQGGSPSREANIPGPSGSDLQLAGWFEMIRIAAFALSLGLSSAVVAADPPKPAPKPEPPKPAPAADEKKPDYEAQFKKKDKDSDGKLTLEEFKTRPMKKAK